ncbi:MULTISPECIES: hypothetical protein [unclassified Caballeronia]|uniref:hypothetical protein n=1 Tax=unclassified Caballeronia TaxID=2646786 RepID=UPI001F32A489|nr:MULTISPECIES: hypothetical protein [unclassified Caballeronia]MCE4544619.1 hypothetical protein [Caballeronia sp. PC1]MCE4571771.1 hypothetical protein [Caballeronia sp. CLC5]
MFDRDSHHYRMAPRSLNDAFGPYAKLHIPRRKSRFAPLLWALFYGVAIAAFWYALVLARAA